MSSCRCSRLRDCEVELYEICDDYSVDIVSETEDGRFSLIKLLLDKQRRLFHLMYL